MPLRLFVAGVVLCCLLSACLPAATRASIVGASVPTKWPPTASRRLAGRIINKHPTWMLLGCSACWMEPDPPTNLPLQLGLEHQLASTSLRDACPRYPFQRAPCRGNIARASCPLLPPAPACLITAQCAQSFRRIAPRRCFADSALTTTPRNRSQGQPAMSLDRFDRPAILTSRSVSFFHI